MISVVIPVYNAMNHIAECLTSLEKQQEPLFETILVDDGSTDLSGDYCDSYAKGKDNIKVIHQKNGGQQAARAEGIKNATGDYILFLDSDDCLRADAIKIISEASANGQFDIVCFEFCRGESEVYNAAFSGSAVLPPGVYEGPNYSSVYAALCSGNFNNLCTKAIKRELALNALAMLDEAPSLRHAEDLHFLIPIIREARSLLCLQDVLYFYRRNPSSVTSSFASTQITDLLYVFPTLIDCASEWGREYELMAKEAATKHLFWSLMSLANSNCTAVEKRKHACSIADGIIEICESDTAVVVARMRFDFKLPIKLLLSGHEQLALTSAGAISRLAGLTNH